MLLLQLFPLASLTIGLSLPLTRASPTGQRHGFGTLGRAVGGQSLSAPLEAPPPIPLRLPARPWRRPAAALHYAEGIMEEVPPGEEIDFVCDDQDDDDEDLLANCIQLQGDEIHEFARSWRPTPISPDDLQDAETGAADSSISADVDDLAQSMGAASLETPAKKKGLFRKVRKPFGKVLRTLKSPKKEKLIISEPMPSTLSAEEFEVQEDPDIDFAVVIPSSSGQEESRHARAIQMARPLVPTADQIAAGRNALRTVRFAAARQSFAEDMEDVD